MSLETFRRCLELVARWANPVQGGWKFVWLNNFGEPLLNPLLPRFVAEATARKVAVSFSSNGGDAEKNPFPRALWRQLAEAGLPFVCLSAHSRTPAALRAHVGDIVPVLEVWEPRAPHLHDWAGQVDMTRVAHRWRRAARRLCLPRDRAVHRLPAGPRRPRDADGACGDGG